ATGDGWAGEGWEAEGEWGENVKTPASEMPGHVKNSASEMPDHVDAALRDAAWGAGVGGEENPASEMPGHVVDELLGDWEELLDGLALDVSLMCNKR
ncbi:MAG: hypothetical protein EA424_25235, partial [Planctomycetaceae bacterium]